MNGIWVRALPGPMHLGAFDVTQHESGTSWLRHEFVHHHSCFYPHRWLCQPNMKHVSLMVSFRKVLQPKSFTDIYTSYFKQYAIVSHLKLARPNVLWFSALCIMDENNLVLKVEITIPPPKKTYHENRSFKKNLNNFSSNVLKLCQW